MRWLAISNLMLVFALGAVANAAPKSAKKRPNAVERKLAHRFFEVAHAYYQQADYERAMQYFRKSYKLSHEPALLFNIGRCQEGLGRLSDAVKSYKRFLELTGRDRPMIKARIHNLERRMSAGSKKPAAKPGPLKKPSAGASTPDEPGQQVANKGAPAGASGGNSTGRSVSPPATDPPPATDAGGGRTWSFWTGWIAAGTGVALLGAGIAFGVIASNKAGSVEGYYADGNRNWSEVKSIHESGNAFEIGQITMLVSGAVLVAGGAALLLFLPRQREPATASAQAGFQLTPVIGAGTYGVAGQLRF